MIENGQAVIDVWNDWPASKRVLTVRPATATSGWTDESWDATYPGCSRWYVCIATARDPASKWSAITPVWTETLLSPKVPDIMSRSGSFSEVSRFTRNRTNQRCSDTETLPLGSEPLHSEEPIDVASIVIDTVSMEDGQRTSVGQGMAGEVPFVVVPVRRARGVGGRDPKSPLYEAVISDEIHVLWEVEDGVVACAPAVCPHRPALGPVLHIRGVVDGTSLLCTRHTNKYSGTNGECLSMGGPGSPGSLNVRHGTRVGSTFVLGASSPLSEGEVEQPNFVPTGESC